MRPLLLCALFVATSFGVGRASGAPPKTLTGVHYVYLVRHGTYDRDTTATDDRISNGLNALGHEQAKLVG